VPDHKLKTIAGKIIHIFAHRFVVETNEGWVLADITPKGLEHAALRLGDTIEIEGEMKPSELKVLRLTVGKTTVIIDQKKPHEHHDDADPKTALKSARNAGYEPIGDPRRKPKHFEVLCRRDHKLTELHIELDGRIRKMKDVAADDQKWRDAISI
jgi:hypothetical protein